MTPERPILRYHGGKWLLAPWIISHLPPHRIYVEPFGGAASVLLRKPRAYAEVYNDLDAEIVNLFQVARDRGAELVTACELTPYAREEFHLSFEPAADPLERARRTAMRSFMGFGGNLTRENRDQSPQRTGFRSYTRASRGSTPAAEWRRWPEELQNIIERLRGVVIEHRDALLVMAEHDETDALHYVDPPYVHSTRMFGAGGTHRGYRFEMTDVQHRDLARALHGLRGMVVLSCYDSPLYGELFGDWEFLDRDHRADGARKRRERLYWNAAASRGRRQLTMSVEQAQTP